MSEITTAELITDLRRMQNSAQVVLDNGLGTHEHDMIYRKRRDLAKNAADRLEQQASEMQLLPEKQEYAGFVGGGPK